MQKKLTSQKSEGESQTTSGLRCAGKSKCRRFEKSRSGCALRSKYGLKAATVDGRVPDEKFETRSLAAERGLSMGGGRPAIDSGCGEWWEELSV